MPKTLDYPYAAFKSCLEVADAVDDLGGSCTTETCAHKLDKQPTSGGFKMILSSSVKYGLISNNRGTLTVSPEYKLIKHAYTEEEKSTILKKLFLKPSVFSSLHKRFTGKALPVEMLDKIMIREMGVDENTASRVGGYFVKGMKEVGLMSPTNMVLPLEEEEVEAHYSENKDSESPSIAPQVKSNDLSQPLPVSLSNSPSMFTISITGPGVNNTFQILEEEDLEWVEVAIRKIKRTLKKSETKDEFN